MNDFYYLSRAILVKDENTDKFDRAFEIYFKGMEKLEDIFGLLFLKIG